MSSPPAWFGKALADAIAKDYHDSLSELEKSQVEHCCKVTGEPPGWFKRGLRQRGLTFRDPCIRNQSNTAPSPGAQT